MTCCDHRQISHRYDLATRANSGACLAPGCGCAGGESAQNASGIRGFSVKVRENVASPQGALTPAGSDHQSFDTNERG